MPIRTILMAAIALAAHSATAQTAKIQPVDTDGDGKYSFAEIAASVPGLTKAAWIAADANGDGSLSPEEFEAARQEGIIPV